MTLQIGRFGIDLASGEVASTSADGNSIRIEGNTAYSDFEKARVLEQQLLGYVDQPDEDFVPVVWDETPQLDGFYRVKSVSFSGEARLAPTGVMKFTVGLERVQGFAAPLVEVSQLGVMRTDTTGWGTRERGFGLPATAASALEVYRVTGVVSRFGVVQRFTRPGETADAVVCSARTDSSIVAYYVAPERFYDAAATFQLGEPLRVVVGRQPLNLPSSWLLSNDLIQVRPAFDSEFKIEYRGWVGGGWSGWESISFRRSFGSSAMPVPHTVVVLRNSPEAVTIRLLSNYLMNPVTVDLTLRRGARYVHTVFSQAGGFGVYALMSNFSSPGDVDPAGWEKTVSGVTRFVASNVPTGPPPSFAPVSIPLPLWQFCFGVTDDVVYPGGTDDSARSVNEWFWAGSEKQSVVAQ